MNRIRYLITRWKGAWRISMGYCPLCNSSPPVPWCGICYGSYDYKDADDTLLDQWYTDYLAYIRHQYL